MVRTTRSLIFEYGNVRKAVELLSEYRAFAESQNVEVLIFGEPWGHSRRIHVHHDHPDAGAAQNWLTTFRANDRARQMLIEVEALAETDMEITMLLEY